MESILIGVGTSSTAKNEIENLLKNREVFDTPKPLKLLKEIIRVSSNLDSIILDFFSRFRVIIVIEANSYVNIRSSRLLPKFKTRKKNNWRAA